MISFVAESGGLKFVRNGIAFYTVISGQNLLSVGKAKNSYKMSHGSFSIKEKTEQKKSLTVNEYNIDGNSAVISLDEGRITVTADNDLLKFDFSGLDSYNRLYFRIPATAEETVYGTGETFAEFNLRGKKANIWVAEHINAIQVAKKLVNRSIGLRDTRFKQPYKNYETYYAQPTFLSSRKYFFHSLTTARSEFDFRDKNFHLIKTDTVASFYIGFGDTFENVISLLSRIVGRQPELPDWVYNGQILGVQGGTDVMMKKLQTALDTDSDVCGVWIQDWEGRRVTAVGKQLFWNWEWDKELYPGLDEKIKELREKNIRVLGYCNPFLAIEKPLYKEASALGYCVKAKDGSDYLVTITTFPAAMVDLTNPDAYEWIKGKIKKNMIEFGFSGWMADFGEYMPTDCVLFSGEDPELVHNTWPARWAKCNREAVEESGKLGDIMFFTRAGFSDTPKNSIMMWNGDNHVDFSIDFGLPSVIPAMLSLTCCGFGLSHSDIGGYTCFFNLKRSEELYMRWCEMNAFSPLMRGHEGINPDLNAQFDASTEVLELGAKMSRNHKALKSYLQDAVKYNSENGIGVIRPLFFYYDEKDAYTEGYEYLLGRDILVAPVLRPKAKIRDVYLPEDIWIHIPTGKEYCGGHVTVDAPIGCPPVFIRKNADVALLETVNKFEFNK